MPRHLVERCGPDSVLTFRRAARLRFAEGVSLANQGHRTGAIYLWGYAAEMTLKAAYFHLLGFPNTRPITFPDLQTAIATATGICKITWPGGPGRLHNVACWAELLVNYRTLLGKSYSDPAVGRNALRHSVRLYECWRETLRYHDNTAYPHEVTKVRDAAEWLVEHARRL